MSDLYTDEDADYRATRVNSGISPPSQRDRRPPRAPANLSNYNPAMRRPQQPIRYAPYSDVNNRQQRHPDERYNNRQDHNAPSMQRPAHNYPPERHYEQQQQRPHEQPQQQQRPQQPQQQQRPQQPQQQQQQLPQLPPPPRLDLRVSTDFLKCEHRLTLEEILKHIQIHDTLFDYEFLSTESLVTSLIKLREKIKYDNNEQRVRARSLSNPFERIGNGIFMNRAAMKIAALDATFGLTTTENNRPLLFADLCGGPGGFTEYLLWRVHSWGGKAHGYGMTLKKDKDQDEMNWHTEKFREDIPVDEFTQIDGIDGTGDIYNKQNRDQFSQTIMAVSQGKGVDLVVADGGINYSGNEDQQEVLSQKLQLCELISMLKCLKEGGTFVCKFFDMITEFTADVVWILYQLFDEICITKPLSSRPPNSERYIVCKKLIHAQPTELIKVLTHIVETYDHSKQKGFIEKSVLEKDEDFVDYVKMRNMKFAMKQTKALELLDIYIRYPQYPPAYDQERIRRHCLAEWRIPMQ